MQIIRHHVFKRQWQKLSRKLQEKAEERITLLMSDEFSEMLNNHKLNPPYASFRSINITGDYRLVYKRIERNTYYLRAVGTHHQLYGT